MIIGWMIIIMVNAKHTRALSLSAECQLCCFGPGEIACRCQQNERQTAELQCTVYDCLHGMASLVALGSTLSQAVYTTRNTPTDTSVSILNAWPVRKHLAERVERLGPAMITLQKNATSNRKPTTKLVTLFSWWYIHQSSLLSVHHVSGCKPV